MRATTRPVEMTTCRRARSMKLSLDGPPWWTDGFVNRLRAYFTIWTYERARASRYWQESASGWIPNPLADGTSTRWGSRGMRLLVGRIRAYGRSHSYRPPHGASMVAFVPMVVAFVPRGPIRATCMLGASPGPTPAADAHTNGRIRTVLPQCRMRAEVLDPTGVSDG